VISQPGLAEQAADFRAIRKEAYVNMSATVPKSAPEHACGAIPNSLRDAVDKGIDCLHVSMGVIFVACDCLSVFMFVLLAVQNNAVEHAKAKLIKRDAVRAASFLIRAHAVKGQFSTARSKSVCWDFLNGQLLDAEHPELPKSASVKAKTALQKKKAAIRVNYNKAVTALAPAVLKGARDVLHDACQVVETSYADLKVLRAWRFRLRANEKLGKIPPARLPLNKLGKLKQLPLLQVFPLASEARPLVFCSQTTLSSVECLLQEDAPLAHKKTSLMSRSKLTRLVGLAFCVV
jgi:hypothetical protein